MRANTIAVVAFNGISPFHLSVPCMVYSEDRLHGNVPRFKLLVCAMERGTLQTSAGFSIRTPFGLGDLGKAGIIIVPSWRDTNEQPPKALIKALQDAHQRGAKIVGLCLGTFVLAAAGLLDGRPAATHWAYADELAQRYPRLEVKPDVLYVDDGDILTSAGVAAGIDCCLHILRTQYGAEVANCVARRMVVPPHRQGGQAQFIQQPLREIASVDLFAQVLDWVQHNLAQQHSLDELAQRALMSRRTFTRRFRQVTGSTVGQWLLSQRLALAQRMLETTDRSIEQVAYDAGFGTAVSMRQHFNAQLKTSPTRYRREFSGV